VSAPPARDEHSTTVRLALTARQVPGNKKPPGPEGSGGFGVAVELG
jgi:hypothetical protein